MNQLQKYYVYVYYDPRTSKPFYVGKGCGRRSHDHLRETETSTDNIFKWRKIASIREAGLEPLIQIHTSGLTEDAAYATETELIMTWGRIGIDNNGSLTNRCNSVRPPCMKGRHFSEEHKAKLKAAYWKRVSQPGYVHPSKGKEVPEHVREAIRQKHQGRPKSETHRKKISDTKKAQYVVKENHPMFGRRQTEETKQKISSANTGKRRTAEQIERGRQCNLGRHRSPETKVRIAKAQAAQWRLTDPQGNSFIVDNLRAWCKEHGYSQGNLWSVANGRLKHAYGYKCEKLS